LQAVPRANDITMHPDFQMIVLANRPGFPFLGNDFFREIGDVFAVSDTSLYEWPLSQCVTAVCYCILPYWDMPRYVYTCTPTTLPKRERERERERESI